MERNNKKAFKEVEQKAGVGIVTFTTLLGDSIIDNKSYVQHGEFSVLEHLEYQSDLQFQQLAYDGHTTENVLSGQIFSPAVQTSSHLVLSVGGNDLLQNIPFLYEGPIENINGAIAGVQQYIFNPLQQRYETIVEKLSSHRANLLLCTVYEGDLGRSDEFSNIIDSSKTMVSAFNDIVYKTANKYGADVLELRDIFVRPEDYANPIEPSHIGGEKLAKAIYDWINL
tara:strand:- start:176 stop:853 length:678 start_codon:yes stop_codon:yes gene_type:complete